MQPREKLDGSIVFVPDPGWEFTNISVKEHRGAGYRVVSTESLLASGEIIDEILSKDLTAEQIIIDAFTIQDGDFRVFTPRHGVRIQALLPEEGYLHIKSDTIVERPN
jgi:hypothetical protein